MNFGVNTGISKKQINNVTSKSNVLYDNLSDNGIIIYCDYFYNKHELKIIRSFMTASEVENYAVVVASVLDFNPDDNLTAGKIKTYRNSRYKLDGYFKKFRGLRIITVGAALYTISPDLMIKGFTNIGFTNSYFYASEFKCNVYPSFGFYDFIGSTVLKSSRAPYAKTWKLNFFYYQVKMAKEQQLYRRELKPIIQTVNSKEDYIKIIQNEIDRGTEYVAWDLETSGFDFRTDKLGCITLSFDGTIGYFVESKYIDKEVTSLMFDCMKQIGANLKFDYKFMKEQMGVDSVRVDDDIIQLGHVLNEIRNKGLKSVAWEYTNFGGYDSGLDDYVEKTKTKNYLKIPTDILKEYATMDAIITYRIFMEMKKQCEMLDRKYRNKYAESWTMWRYYHEIMMPAVNTFASAEYHGIVIDKEELDKSAIAMKNLLNESLDAISTKIGIPKSDIGSPTKLGKFLEKAGWENLGTNKRGIYQTGDEQLAAWATIYKRDGAAELREYRSRETAYNMFIGSDEDGKGWRKFLKFNKNVNEYTVHPTYALMLANSGRGKCSRPNFQQGMSGSPYAKYQKRIISVPKNMKMMSIDYSGLQLRIAGILGKEKSVVDLFSDPKVKRTADIHSRTGFQVFASNKTFNVTEYHVTDEKGLRYTLLSEQTVETQRGRVKAKDLKETDTIKSI